MAAWGWPAAVAVRARAMAVAALKGEKSGPPNRPTCCPVRMAPAPWLSDSIADSAAGDGFCAARRRTSSGQCAGSGGRFPRDLIQRQKGTECSGAKVHEEPALTRHYGYGITVCGRQFVHLRLFWLGREFIRSREIGFQLSLGCHGGPDRCRAVREKQPQCVYSC